MSKQKAEHGTTVPEVKKGGIFTHLAKAAAKRAKQIKEKKGFKPLLIITIIGAIALIIDQGTMYGTALLYLFAFDGTVSGRMDANVLSRNGTGRRFTVPTLVQNAYTATQRTLLATMSSAWSALSQSEQDTWLNVDNQFYTNRLGVTKILKGKSLFVRRNINLLMTGNGPEPVYPGTAAINSITSFDPTGTAVASTLTTLSAVFSASPTDADVVHLIFATKVLGAGINRPKQSAYRLIGALAAGDATPTNILTEYSAKFGDVAVTGQKIGLKLTPINTNTGQSGTDIVSVITLG